MFTEHSSGMSRSRPGSSRPERQSHTDRAVPNSRHGSSETENFTTECKAAYLAVFDDVSANIESKQGLCKGIRATFSYHHPSGL